MQNDPSVSQIYRSQTFFKLFLCSKMQFKVCFYLINVNGKGIFIDHFTFENYIIRRFYHRQRLGSHILIRYILYFRDKLQEYANWHPNTLKYIKRLHFSTVASPATARITYISIRHILFFSMNCKNYQNGTQLLWHTLKNYIIGQLHHRRRLGSHILIQYILSFYLLLS